MNKLTLSEPAIIKISRSEEFPFDDSSSCLSCKKNCSSPQNIYHPFHPQNFLSPYPQPPPQIFSPLKIVGHPIHQNFSRPHNQKIFPTPSPKMFPSPCCTLPHSTLRPSCGSKFSNFSFATRTTLSFAHYVVKILKNLSEKPTLNQ